MSYKDTDIQVTLNYIDKVFAELDRTGTAINRAALVTLTVSALQLLAAAGWLSSAGDISLFGFGVKATFVVLLLCSMLILACFLAYVRALALRGGALSKEIRRLYETIGYTRQADAMEDTLASPFRSSHFSRVLAAQHFSRMYPPPSSSTLEREYARYSSLIIEYLVRWFPTLAEIGGVVKVVYIVGLQNPLWVLTLAFPVVTTFTMLAYPPSYFRPSYFSGGIRYAVRQRISRLRHWVNKARERGQG